MQINVFIMSLYSILIIIKEDTFLEMLIVTFIWKFAVAFH